MPLANDNLNKFEEQAFMTKKAQSSDKLFLFFHTLTSVGVGLLRVSQGASLGDFLLAPMCPIKKGNSSGGLPLFDIEIQNQGGCYIRQSQMGQYTICKAIASLRSSWVPLSDKGLTSSSICRTATMLSCLSLCRRLNSLFCSSSSEWRVRWERLNTFTAYTSPVFYQFDLSSIIGVKTAVHKSVGTTQWTDSTINGLGDRDNHAGSYPVRCLSLHFGP